MKRKNTILENLRYIIILISQYDKKILWLSMLSNAMEKGFYSFFFVYFIKFVYDLIEGKADYLSISLFLVVVSIVQIVVYFCSTQYDYYAQVATPKILERFYLNIFYKANSIPLEDVEDPEYYEKYTRALDNAQHSVTKIISLLGELAGQITRFVLLVIMTILIDPIVLLLPFICISNSVIVAWFKGRIEYRQRKELTEYERKCAYSKRVFYEKKYSQELRLYNVKALINDLYNDSIDKLKGIKESYLVKLTFLDIWDKFVIRLFLLVIACIYLSYRMIEKSAMTVGEFAAAMAAISNISYCTSYLSYYIEELFKNGADSYNLISFLQYEVKKEEKQNNYEYIGDLECLKVEDLSYIYNSCGENVLKNISFSINRGEKIAIVGSNGAGKTTLVKIILGLYKEYTGSILWNNLSITQIDSNEYKKHIISVLQDFSVYELSVASNVAMSDNTENKERIVAALNQVGMGDKINKLPLGVESNISKELDSEGVNFSGGELQKIALARIFYNEEADLIVLDEPTSAMDPVSEFNVFHNLFQNLQEKTMIFVSHRLLTCTMADRILMMDNGEIVECGTHEELMKLNGKYAEMYNIQASKIA